MKDNAIYLTVDGPDFCASAVFDIKTRMCIASAPKLEALQHMDFEKAERRCREMGWKTDAVEIVYVRPIYLVQDLEKEDGPIRARLIIPR